MTFSRLNNTKSFQKHQPHNKVRSLTLGEVSIEIHHLKSEISSLKSRIAKLEKGKQLESVPYWNTTTSYQNPNVEIIEGQKDPILGFREMRIMAIEY